MKPFWYGSCYRVKDIRLSVNFFKTHFGMFLVHDEEIDGVRYSCLISPKVNEKEQDFFSTKQKGLPAVLLNRSCLCLRSATPNELASGETLNNGNEEPYRGFGHIAFNCNDVYESCSRLEQEGVKFRKRPDEGRMKGLAFCLDPDGYFIEICQRGSSQRPEPFNLSQTMIRVKDPKKSIAFYGDVLGMVLVREMHMSDFSNYFMASLPRNIDPEEYSTEKQRDFVHSLWNPCLELTHNHGTEDDPKFFYHNGNQPPRVGFSHLSFHAEDLQSIEKAIENGSYHVKRCGISPAEARDAFRLEDPDGYTIEIIPRRHFNGE